MSKSLVCLFLMLTTLGVYWGVRNSEFVTLDDYSYVAGNPHVQSGLTRKGLIWSFTRFHSGNWHPLTWLSHMLDCEIFGLKAGLHHLTNLIFHIANTLLLFLIFEKMTGAFWRSAAVAALFALHPLHVESVAWIAERKDALSTFFWILTMWAYIRYVEGPGPIRYLLMVFFYILGLMSKPMLVTLPFVLLLMDYWPLCRLRGGLPDKVGAPRLPQQRPFRLILEKAPLFALAAASSVVALFAQGDALQPLEAFPATTRIANALVSYVAYIRNMFWPADLCIFYPYPQTSPLWEAALCGVFIIALSVVFFRMAQRRPYAPVGWFWYLGTLVPVIGLVQVGNQAMADRYTYVPLIGLFIIIVWGIPDLLGRWTRQKHWMAISAGILMTALSIGAWLQVRHWKDSIALFSHAIEATEDNWMAHNNIGFPLVQKGRIREAVQHFSEAVRIKPGFAEAHMNLANTYALEERFGEAAHHFSEAIKANPDFVEAYVSLGIISARQGDLDKAIRYFATALDKKPDDARIRLYLDRALEQRRRMSGHPDSNRPDFPLNKTR